MIYNYAKPKTTPSTPKSSFATAPGNAMAGKTLSAPGNAANKVVIAANKASGGTTTSTYRDKYTAAEGGPGASASEAAAMTQAAGFAKIFDKVHATASAANVAQGKAAPVASTYTMEHPDPKKVIKIEGTSVTVAPKTPPVTKIIASPSPVQGQTLTATASQAPAYAMDSRSPATPVDPMKGSVQDAANNVLQGLADRFGYNVGPGSTMQDIIRQSPLAAGQPKLVGPKYTIPAPAPPKATTQAANSFAGAMSGLISQLAPGITARISAKGRR